jgi:hypothetical protein
MVVSRTRDGGRSFEVLTEGLPQHGAYHLVYRHGLDVSPDGERLVFGSTTGSVWTGADAAGPHPTFRLVTSTLPPVLCLRYE